MRDGRLSLADAARSATALLEGDPRAQHRLATLLANSVQRLTAAGPIV